MRKPYEHPTLGALHKLDLSKGSVQSSGVWGATLLGLVHYLNEAHKHRGAETVLEILEGMLELEKMEPPLWTERIDGPMIVMKRGRGAPNPLLKRIAPDKYRTQIEIDERGFEINRKLAQYRFIPLLLRSGDRQWVLSWHVSPRGRERINVKNGVMQLNDGMALQTILDLFRAGYGNRLRRCSRCSEWFYAKVAHQSFCSIKCQQKLYAQSPKWKEKRRKYMQRYRQQMI